VCATENTEYVGLKRGIGPLSKINFEAKKVTQFNFLRCGNTLKKRCRKYRAKLAILKNIQTLIRNNSRSV